LRWWRESCLDWCYARLEDGKFGDQKYLDDWPERFAGVHELQHLGGGVAPWNVYNYDFYYKDEKIYGKEISTHKEFNIIFFHFHHAKLYNMVGVIKAKYFQQTNKPSEKLVYREYEKFLNAAFQKIKKLVPSFSLGFASNKEFFIEAFRENIPAYIKQFYRKIAYGKKNQS